jgi:hypothetical protein
MILGTLILCYWCYVAMIGVVWWAVASVVHRRIDPWPVPAHAWTFWRHREAAAASHRVASGTPRALSSTPQVIQVTVAGPSTESATAAQINALASPETAKAIQNLQNLLYTHAITDEEFQAAKKKLLGDLAES